MRFHKLIKEMENNLLLGTTLICNCLSVAFYDVNIEGCYHPYSH